MRWDWGKPRRELNLLDLRQVCDMVDLGAILADPADQHVALCDNVRPAAAAAPCLSGP